MEALHRLERGKEVAENLPSGEPACEAALAVAFGAHELLRKDPAAAEMHLRRARAQFSAAGDSHGELVAGERLSWTLLALGRWEEAEASFAWSLELAHSLGDSLTEAAASLGHGLALKNLGRTRGEDLAERAVVELEAARARALRLDLPSWRAEAAVALSIIRAWRNEFDRSLALRVEALRAYESIADTGQQAACLQRIASIYLRHADYARALGLLHRGLRLAKAAGSPQTAGWITLNLGNISYLAGDNESAAHLFAEARSQGEESGDQVLQAAGFMNTGVVLTEMREFGRALVAFEEALDVCRSIRDRRGEVRTLQNTGLCLYKMGRYEDAIRRLVLAQQVARELGGEIGITRAYLARDIGLCRAALGAWAAAESSLSEAAELAQSADLPSLLEDVCWGRAQAARERGDLRGALTLLEQAISLHEGLRGRLATLRRIQSSAFGRKGAIYAEAVDILHELHGRDSQAGHDRRAFEIAQCAKARSLLDLLTEAEVDLRCRADPRYQEREADLLEKLLACAGRSAAGEKEISAREAEIARLEQELDLLEGELREADPRYADLAYPRPSSLERIQVETLEPGEILLEYLLGDSASFVWSVSRDAVRFRRLPGRAELEREVRGLLPLLADYNLVGQEHAYYVEAAREISRVLLRPRELDGARRLIVAPDGVLHYLPFEVLLFEDAGAATADFSSLPYLVRDIDVLYIPSAIVLDQMRRIQPPRWRGGGALLLIGDPVAPPENGSGSLARAILGKDPAPTPFADAEMAAIRQRYPAGSLRILSGPEATEEMLRRVTDAAAYDLVHFATHGLFNERRPRYSGLVLSLEPRMRGDRFPGLDAGTRDDGFLSLGEIFALDLPCRQVVLSACSSALGEEVSGEGLVGLTRAFLYAGARSTVATLWEVSGEATSIFMADLYGRLARGDTDRAAALAQTKRRMIASGERGPGGIPFAHPYFWGAFTLTGDPR